MLRLMNSVVFIRPGYCGDIWYISRTLQRTKKPLCYQHTWYRFYDEIEYKYSIMILVVDDDKNIRLSLKLILERNEYEVALAEGSKEAM